MTIQARYSGTCPECGGRWQPGDLIRGSDRQFTGGPSPVAWVHAVCPDDPADATTLRPGEQVCTTCWLVHPEGACDR